MFFCLFLFFILSSQNRTYFTMITLGHHTHVQVCQVSKLILILTMLQIPYDFLKFNFPGYAIFRRKTKPKTKMQWREE